MADKTYEFEGRQYRESGEKRRPQDGDIWLNYNGAPMRMTPREYVDDGYDDGKRRILVPVEPRILTGYVPDAKAGDVYDYHGERWQLVEQRAPRDGDNWISHGHYDPIVWGGIWRDYAGVAASRWIVVPSPPAAAEGQPGEKPDLVAEALSGSRGDEQKRIAEVGIGWLTTMLQKNRDYGGAVYQTPVFTPHLSAGDAILVRMSDKVSRLSSLLKSGGKPEVNESLDDTLKDLGAYSLLYLARPDAKENACPPNAS